MMSDRDFRVKLLKWYEHNQRELPWRNTDDPYKIWLSEVILQQTRVVQGLPYFEAFALKFPTVHDLASADESLVLRTWQGLGYYSRARNLHTCAKIIVEKYAGKFPDSYQELLKLPGVGPYTAAAIASFAFKEIIPVVDGNVYRVLSRVFGIETDIASSGAYKIFKSKADELIDPKNPDVFNQAIMEFGATACLPKNPDCAACMYKYQCIAHINNLQSQLPVKLKKTKVRKRYFNYVVFKSKDQILMNQRLEKDIWKNMFDFKLVESDSSLPERELTDLKIINNNKKHITSIDISNEYKHILSHQQIIAKFITVELKDKPDFNGAEWFEFSQILDLPKPVLISTYLQEHIF